MLSVPNNELNLLRQQQQILYRKEDRHEITSKEYDEAMALIEEKIQQKMSETINNMTLRPLLNVSALLVSKEKNKVRMETMPEEKKEVKVRVKKEKPVKVKRETRVGVILETLKMRSIKNLEQATDKVLEKIPGSNRKNVSAQICLTIGKIKKGAGVWAKYKWDAESYTVTEVSQ